MNIVNDTKKIVDNEALCVLPWVHLHIATNGDVTACALVKKPFGNINANTIDEIWNGGDINEFRKNLLNNVKDARCHPCYSKEASGVRSSRQNSNYNYSRHFLRITSMVDSSNSKASPPRYWDIRFSNICNFRCRTCYHGASSRWFDDAAKLGETVSSKPIIRAVKDLDKFYLQIEESIDNIEEIYFAGGEPLVMEEHYKILEILERKNDYSKYLRYNTNFSTFQYKDINVLNVWSKFTKVAVGASLDGWGKRGEFLRKEQKWDEVLANRQSMKVICPNVYFFVSVTVSVFNVFHLPDFHRQLVSANFIRVEEFSIGNILQTPIYFSVQILPLEFKLKIKEKIEQHIDWIAAYINGDPHRSRANGILQQFRNCITYLFADDLAHHIPQFVARCNAIDKLRSENVAEVFPELRFMFAS